MKSDKLFANCHFKTNNSSPLYLQLKNYFLTLINSDELSPGDLLPSEFKLCTIFNLSRNTVRKAIKELCNEKILYTIKGSGTYVSDTTIYHTFNELLPIYAKSISQQIIAYDIVVLEFKTTNCNLDIAQKLNLNLNDPVIYLKRLYEVKSQPIFYCETFITNGVINDIFSHDMSKVGLYKLISTNSGATIHSSKKTLKSAIATKIDLEIFRTKRMIPLLIENVISYNKFYVPIETSFIKYNGALNTIIYN